MKILKNLFYPFVGTKENTDGLGLAYVNTTISKNGGFIKLKKKKYYNL